MPFEARKLFGVAAPVELLALPVRRISKPFSQELLEPRVAFFEHRESPARLYLLAGLLTEPHDHVGISPRPELVGAALRLKQHNTFAGAQLEDRCQIRNWVSIGVGVKNQVDRKST